MQGRDDMQGSSDAGRDSLSEPAGHDRTTLAGTGETPTGARYDYGTSGAAAAGMTGGMTGDGSAADDLDAARRASMSAGTTARHAQSEFGAFLDDLSELVRGPSASQGTELRGELERRVQMARSHMDNAMQQAQQAGAALGDRVQRGLSDTRVMVSEKPLQSVLMAAAGGVILGMLLARRR